MTEMVASQSLVQSSSRAVGRHVRREEIAIAATLVVATALCLWTGTGFTGVGVFLGYLAYFGRYGLYLFVFVRLAQLVRVHWRPRGRLGGRILDWLGGPSDARRLFDGDIEFIRGFFLLLVTITVYTNLKVRIPLINATVGDDFFQALDNLLLGERLVPWIEKFAELNPFWALRADRVYNHGFIWMILLLLLLWIRNDRPRMRWLFGSFCLIYMVGIFMTVAYPSYGPFLIDWERFRWAAGTASGGIQARLVDVYVETLNAVEQGRPVTTRAFFGIAAFPSLHVAFMVMLTVVSWRTARLFAIFMIGVAVATTVSTLVFGWHYLVDALAGAALAIAIPLAIRPWVFGSSGSWPHPEPLREEGVVPPAPNRPDHVVTRDPA